MQKTDTMLQNGITAYNKKDFTNAEIYFQEYCKNHPNESLSYYNLSKVYQSKNELSKAKEYVQKALSLEPQCSDYYYLLGCIQADLRLYKEAFDLFTKSSHLETDFVDSIYNAGVMASVLGDVDVAENNFKKVLSIEPEYLFAHNFLANSYLKKHKWKEAKRELDSALSICPDDPIVHHTYAVYYLNLKEYQKALEQINLSINNQSRFTPKHYFLKAEIYYYMEDFDESIKICNQIIESDPSFPFSYDGLGNNYMEKGDFKTAIKYFEKAITFSYSVKNSYEKLKIIYKKLNKEQDLARVTQQMNKLFPSKKGIE